MAIRFILRRKMRDNRSGLERQDLFTIDADVPELQAALATGGHGPDGFESTFIMGAEILPKSDTNSGAASVNEDMLAALRAVVDFGDGAKTPKTWADCLDAVRGVIARAEGAPA